MTEYIKSITGDFGGNVLTSQLQQEIETNATIQAALLRIDTSDDVVTIVFDTPLASEEVTELNSLIAAHTPSIVSSHVLLSSLIPRANQYKNIAFSRVSSFIYEGRQATKAISQVAVVAYMTDGITNYTLRMIDKADGAVLFQETFTNTSETLLVIDNISNVPYNLSTLEIQVKRTGGTANQSVYIESISVLG